MKMIIFSDIHGNQYAFREFLKQIKQIEYNYLIFCGDIFGYYYGQQEIIDSLSQLENLIWLKGNHDDNATKIFFGELEADYFIANYGQSYGSILSNCTNKQMKKIKSLPSQQILNIGTKKIGIYHGTPEDHLNGRLYPKDIYTVANMCNSFDYLILGHTHFRLDYQIKDTRIINPGSLGQYRDGKGFGYYVLDLDCGNGKYSDINIDLTELYAEIDKYDKSLTKLKDVLERRV